MKNKCPRCNKEVKVDICAGQIYCKECGIVIPQNNG